MPNGKCPFWRLISIQSTKIGENTARSSEQEDGPLFSFAFKPKSHITIFIFYDIPGIWVRSRALHFVFIHILGSFLHPSPPVERCLQAI